MNPSSLFTQGQGSSATSTSRTGDFGPLNFNSGGLSFGGGAVQGIDPRWLIGGLVVGALMITLLLTRKGR